MRRHLPLALGLLGSAVLLWMLLGLADMVLAHRGSFPGWLLGGMTGGETAARGLVVLVVVTGLGLVATRRHDRGADTLAAGAPADSTHARAEEAMLLRLFEVAPIGLGLTRGGVLVAANERLAELSGPPAGALVGRSVADLTREVLDAEQFFADVDEQLADRNRARVDLRWRAADGSIRSALLTVAELTKVGDEVTHVFSFLDVTDLKRTEAELHRLAAAVEQTSESVVITDAQEKVTYANPACERLLGYRREELLGRRLDDVRAGSSDAASDLDSDEISAEGEVWRGRETYHSRDGIRRHVLTARSPIRDDGGELVGRVLVSRDLSHEEELEAQIRHAQKMESLGALAGGIAHNFNNILQAVLGFTTLARDEVPDTSTAAADLGKAVRAVRRGQELVQRILAFSRQEEQELRPLVLSDVVTDAVALLQSTIPPTITVTTDLDPDAGVVLADPARINQIVMNLATNAYHAMEESSGALTIRVGSVRADDALPTTARLRGHDLVMLAVADTGHGMERAEVERIFDPFYTTKPVGRGTGLGLSVVHGIVTSHGGEITTESRVGEGTTVRVYLPRVAEDHEAPVTSGAGSGEHVLFLDDEPDVAQIGRSLLERHGYRVTAHLDARAALADLDSRAGDFDLVISDYAMPDITGMQVADRVAELRPDLPVLLITGLDDRTIEGLAGHAQIRGIVNKPFDANQLVRMVRSSLGTR